MLSLAEPKTVSEMRRPKPRLGLKGTIMGQGLTREAEPFPWRFREARDRPRVTQWS